MVRHCSVDIDGCAVFYREEGAAHLPAVLMPHGYPCSSYEFRNLMPLLGDRWRLIAPDLPGFGYSATPQAFDYSFAGYADWLQRFANALELQRLVLYLHDYGTWIALRLAMREPGRIAGLIIQNGDIYEDTMGPKYAALKAWFAHPTAETHAELEAAVSEEGFRDEFLNEVAPGEAARIAPDLWTLHWALATPRRKQIYVRLMEDLKSNMVWFPRYQAFLRTHQPPALICWGPRDGFMPEPAARAYLRDLPDADLNVFPTGGHWLLETHLAEVSPLIRRFLQRVHSTAH